PIDGVANAFLRRPCPVAEFAFGLGRREEHMLLRHAQPVEREQRFSLGHMRYRFGEKCERVERRTRQAHARRRVPRKTRTPGQQLGERHVLPAENVALTDPARLKRRKMSSSDVVDVHDIETGIDKGWHASRRSLDDYAPGWRRAPVARADRRRWVDDDGRKPVR